MSNYKVHIPYINTHGTLINKGIYSGSEIDLAEARNKSVVTLVNSTVDIKIKPTVNELPVLNFNVESNSPNIVKEVKLDTTQKTITVTKLKINSTNLEELQALKYVGKVTAEKVINFLKKSRITSYSKLDEIAPLKSKSWEDICVIDFENDINPITLENSVQINETN